MLGAFFMIVAMTLLPIGDAAGKHLSGVAPYAPSTMAWIRFVAVTVVLSPLALFWIRNTRFDRFFFVSQGLRGVLISATITLILTAVTRIPMADAFGAFFIGPAGNSNREPTMNCAYKAMIGGTDPADQRVAVRKQP